MNPLQLLPSFNTELNETHLWLIYEFQFTMAFYESDISTRMESQALPIQWLVLQILVMSYSIKEYEEGL